MANAFRRRPEVVRRILEGTARYKKWQKNQYEIGRSYEPKFPWPEELLKEDPASITDIVRECVKKKDRTYILFDAEPHDAVKELKLEGNVLSAKVKSKRAPDETRPLYHENTFRSVLLGRYGSPQVTVINCSDCEDFSQVLKKGGKPIRSYIHCVHNSAMRSEFEERMRFNVKAKNPMIIKGEKPKPSDVFSPFNFVSNWIYVDGVYQPDNRHLAALEGDVLVTYYVIQKEVDDIFGINERLLTIEECYSPSMLDWIRAGKVTRRVIGQRRKTAKLDASLLEEEETLSENLDREIKTRGYEYDGRCRELGRRVADRYVNKETGVSVNVVFSGTGPPFYTVREPIPNSKIIPTGEYAGETNPFKLVGRRNLRAFDDVNMEETKMRVELPTVLRLPGTGDVNMKPSKQMRRFSRDAIREAHGGEVTGIEKYTRVHFLSPAS